MAATLRRELRDEGDSERRPVRDDQPRHSKEVIVEACLLLQLSGKIVDDCGVCGNCLDKRKFGGLGVRKRACRHKVKIQTVAPSAPAPPPVVRPLLLPDRPISTSSGVARHPVRCS